MPLPRLVVAAAVALFSATTAAADDWVFFGTQTGGKGASASKGIYRSKFDPATGKLTAPELAAEVTEPSFLAAHPGGRFLYAVGGGDKDGGPVIAYAIDARTGALTKLNQTTSGGGGPCHVRVSPDGQYLGVANYGGSAAFFKLEMDGKIGERVALHTHTGDKDARTHSVAFARKSSTAFVAVCGHDRVKVYASLRTERTELFVPHARSEIVLPPGTGPRHIDVIAPNTVAVNGEADSTVSLILPWLDPKDKGYRTTLSTLPAGWKGNNSTAEVKFGKPVSDSDVFVYVSNRGHDSVAVFEVKGFNNSLEPKMKAVGHITGDIKTPRNFNIDPSGKWMLIASQDGDKVGVWALDPKTGLGKETGNTVAVGKPMCVTFVAAAK